MCACEREREREREIGPAKDSFALFNEEGLSMTVRYRGHHCTQLQLGVFSPVGRDGSPPTLIRVVPRTERKRGRKRTRERERGREREGRGEREGEREQEGRGSGRGGGGRGREKAQNSPYSHPVSSQWVERMWRRKVGHDLCFQRSLIVFSPLPPNSE